MTAETDAISGRDRRLRWITDTYMGDSDNIRIDEVYRYARDALESDRIGNFTPRYVAPLSYGIRGFDRFIGESEHLVKSNFHPREVIPYDYSSVYTNGAGVLKELGVLEAGAGELRYTMDVSPQALIDVQSAARHVFSYRLEDLLENSLEGRRENLAALKAERWDDLPCREKSEGTHSLYYPTGDGSEAAFTVSVGRWEKPLIEAAPWEREFAW